MLEDIRLAFQGIWSHKLRSALTMLGIIIGIGAIIAIVSTIQGQMSRSSRIVVEPEITQLPFSFIRMNGRMRWITMESRTAFL